MKKTLMAVLMCVAVPAWPSDGDWCAPMDYAEVKDMTAPELLQRYCRAVDNFKLMDKVAIDMENRWGANMAIATHEDMQRVADARHDATRCSDVRDQAKRVLVLKQMSTDCTGVVLVNPAK